MSYIAFHTKGRDEVLLRGWEAYNVRALAVEPGEKAFLRNPEMTMRLLRNAHWPSRTGYGDHYVLQLPDGDFTDQQLETLRTFISVGWSDVSLPTPTGRQRLHSTLLNEAVMHGGSLRELCARIAATAGVHGWVKAEDGDWMAGIIETGLNTGLLREGLKGDPSGWRDVIALLRETTDSPIVMSESAGHGFPDDELIRHVRKVVMIDDEPFIYYKRKRTCTYDLPADVRWDLAEAGLRKREPNFQVQIKPGLNRGFGEAEVVYSATELLEYAATLPRDKRSVA